MTGFRRGRSAVMARCVVAAAVLRGVVGVGILTPTPAGATTTVQQVSSDPLTNSPTLPSGVHHATEVETDTLAHGSTIVSSFQVGRYSAYGASATGWATSTDGGQTWQHGLLPGLSNASPSPNSAYVGVANQSVLYDAAHGTWLIPTVGVVSCSSQVPASRVCVGHTATEHTLMVSRSTDGLNWGLPVTAVASNVDKPWGVCDNSPVSPYYGTCYVAYAQIDDGDRIALVHTTDGGQTWSAPVDTTTDQGAYNAIPVVQPNGRLVDRRDGRHGERRQRQSAALVRLDDGGATLSDAATGPNALPVIQYHTPAGGIRGKNKPSVDVDAAGTIYVAWGDCRFRTACAENDIVFATSTDGVQYSAPDPRGGRRRHQFGRSLHPRLRRAAGDIGCVGRARRRLLLLRQHQLHDGHLPPERAVLVVDRRRGALDHLPAELHGHAGRLAGSDHASGRRWGTTSPSPMPADRP